MRVVFSKGRKTNPSAKKQGPSKNRGVLVLRVAFSRQWHAGRGASGPTGSSERRSPTGTSAQMVLLGNSDEKNLACLASERLEINWASKPTESRKLCVRACVCAGYEHAGLSFLALATYVTWGLSGHLHSVTISMASPVFSRISARASGRGGGLKLKAPVAIRADMRHIFRLVGCRKTPASWCSEPAPRSHARVLLKLCSNRKTRPQKEPVPNCDCAGS